MSVGRQEDAGSFNGCEKQIISTGINKSKGGMRI